MRKSNSIDAGEANFEANPAAERGESLDAGRHSFIAPRVRPTGATARAPRVWPLYVTGISILMALVGGALSLSKVTKAPTANTTTAKALATAPAVPGSVSRATFESVAPPPIVSDIGATKPAVESPPSVASQLAPARVREVAAARAASRKAQSRPAGSPKSHSAPAPERKPQVQVIEVRAPQVQVVD